MVGRGDIAMSPEPPYTSVNPLEVSCCASSFGLGASGLFPEEVCGLSIPLADGTEFMVSKPLMQEWVMAFPAVDVPQTLRHMRQWALAQSPAKRKTRRGVQTFAVNWLAKKQDESSRYTPSAPPKTAEKFNPTEYVNRGRTDGDDDGKVIQGVSSHVA